LTSALVAYLLGRTEPPPPAPPPGVVHLAPADEELIRSVRSDQAALLDCRCAVRALDRGARPAGRPDIALALQAAERRLPQAHCIDDRVPIYRRLLTS
jgi:hypothetical protein